MGLIRPDLPDFDLEDWSRRPYAQRVRLMAQSWAVQGWGAPAAAYAFYVLKIAFYVGVWAVFVTLTPGIGGFADIGSWWAEPIAFQKAVVWTLAFESLGLGAASGPMTARYVPPVGGFLYFARPGTTRLPPFPRLPGTAGHRRSVLDVALYVAHLGFVLRALLAPEMTPGVLLPIVVTLPLLGLRDKTIFLAARSEHYYTTLLVFLFAGDVIAGSKAVMVAIWWWAATSKLNHHFPSVITVMVSNHPVLRWRSLRTAMYRDYPDDLRPSRLATWGAHAGLAIEYGFPVLLVLGSGGWVTTVGLAVMTLFHLYITTSVPAGVPNEWNIFFLYAAFALFGVHADVRLWSIDAPLLVAILVVALFVVPLVGNLRPDLVSFLPSMRYYAGNWATSMWAFRGDAAYRLDEHIVKAAPHVRDQLLRFYDDATADALLGKALAFRAMHLHGRALHDLMPRALDDIDEYEILDGEIVAGLVLGWNFGDGHLHHEQLLDAVQSQCGFEEGELRCVFLESQPLGRTTLHWRIADAAAGRLEEGHVEVGELLASQPWPDAEAVPRRR